MQDKYEVYLLQNKIKTYEAWTKRNPVQVDSFGTYAAYHTDGNPKDLLQKHIWKEMWGIPYEDSHGYFNKAEAIDEE